MKTLIKIDADTFHYTLGSFKHNLGDDHCWIFDQELKDEVRLEIIDIFTKELNKLFEGLSIIKE